MSEYIVTQVEYLPREQVRIHYLLPGGRRPAVTINAWENNSVTRDKLARSLMGVENAIPGSSKP